MSFRKGKYPICKFQVLRNQVCTEYLRIYHVQEKTCQEQRSKSSALADIHRQLWEPCYPEQPHLHLAAWSSSSRLYESSKHPETTQPWGAPMGAPSCTWQLERPVQPFRLSPNYVSPGLTATHQLMRKKIRKTLNYTANFIPPVILPEEGIASRTGTTAAVLRGRTLDRMSFGSYRQALFFCTPM